MKRILKRLDSVHQRLLDTVTPLNAETFSKRPSPDEWSVAEIVQHLSLVEQRVLKDLQRGLRSNTKPVGFLRRFIPTFIVASRVVRVKAPKAVNPTTVPEKTEALESFNSVRDSLKRLCADYDALRLKQAVFKHPFLGDIDGVATISFVSYHEHRHLKQIREVLQKLN